MELVSDLDPDPHYNVPVYGYGTLMLTIFSQCTLHNKRYRDYNEAEEAIRSTEYLKEAKTEPV